MDRRRRDGVVFVVISAMVFSTAGLFTKGVSASAWDVVFWRGLTAAIFTFLFVAFRGEFGRELRAFGWPAFAVAAVGAVGTSAFIPAFKFSTVANVALIYAASPFVAAGIAWLWMREVPSRVTLIGAVVALAGVGVIVSGSLGSGSLIGDGLAMIMTLMMSMVMVIYRRYPGTTAAMPAAMSSVFLLPPGLIFGAPFAVGWAEIGILTAFGLVFAVASVTLAEGARRLAPGETALLSALEVPLAPLLALLVLSEMPVNATWIGGVMVFAAVVWAIVAENRDNTPK